VAIKFYVEFISASEKHIFWLREIIRGIARVSGHITKGGGHITYQLKYAKAESLKLLPKLYYDKAVVCLSRKRKKIEKALEIVGRQL